VILFRSTERTIWPNVAEGQAVSFSQTKHVGWLAMASRHEDAVTGGDETAAASGQERPGAPAARRALLDALFQAGREVSAAAVMFHTALAAHQGLTATEEKALDLLDRNGPLTGRQLAERSGLAPASVTSLVDRLEAKGFARRTRNPADGRSVLIETTPDRLAGLGPLFADWVRELEELCAQYTDAELAVITSFLAQSARRQKDATARLTSVAAGKDQAGATQAGH
jgi:DNA-binding MarR family transcriptional regulator